MRVLRMRTVLMAGILMATLPALTWAQSAETQRGDSTATQTQRSPQTSAPAIPQNPGPAAAPVRSTLPAKLAAIVERGAKAPAKARDNADAKIQSSVNDVNDKAVTDGNAKVAERFAAEFGMPAEAVTAEKQNTGMSWGEWMVAHTLHASHAADLTIDEIYLMKKDGNGWSQIAMGMGFKLGDVVNAVRAESRVGAGRAKADGKVQVIAATGNAGAAGPEVGTGVGLQSDGGMK